MSNFVLPILLFTWDFNIYWAISRKKKFKINSIYYIPTKNYIFGIQEPAQCESRKTSLTLTSTSESAKRSRASSLE